MTTWLIVIYHRRTFTGWTGSLMGCEQKTQKAQKAQRGSATTKFGQPGPISSKSIRGTI